MRDEDKFRLASTSSFTIAGIVLIWLMWPLLDDNYWSVTWTSRETYHIVGFWIHKICAVISYYLYFKHGSPGQDTGFDKLMMIVLIGLMGPLLLLTLLFMAPYMMHRKKQWREEMSDG